MPSPTPIITVVILVSSLAVALFAVWWNSFSQKCVPIVIEAQHSRYFEYEYTGKPHHSSWHSWWHPQRIWSSAEASPGRGQGGGAVTHDWNILYHLGGNGPWVEKVDNVVEGGIAVPDGCAVDQVHMMSRHAERYPTFRVGRRMIKLLDRMKQSRIRFQGDLAFVNHWELFWSDDSQMEQLTSTGPFSGTLGSFTTGVRLRTRYHNLLANPKSLERKTRFWASDSERVIDTARYFGAGFFGLDWERAAHLEIIPERSDLGGNTLTPGDTCLKYIEDTEEGHDKGPKTMQNYRATYMPAIRERLLKQNPGMEFTDDEIYAMQEMCGFETTVRGSSHWCDVFTQNEFLNFEYARDILHYYRAGPGTKYGAVMGWLWLNATTNLMLEGPSAGPLFFSFVHDGDIAPMITALDIINDDEHLPITHIPSSRKWRKSQVSPMGGRIIFELLSCGTQQNHFVRININDGITTIPECDGGPGSSCPLAEFRDRVKRKGEEVGHFREKCGLDDEAPERITFLHQ
ncbi:phosphoglycerate mutase-like protein [Lindgomyces ingoldianus]|uniref:Phosphoglycerate mutase-like protein n=1 Tax=Lindgomyces ingoldianus TaxID=673940 RepID=A0ACB6QHB1_9PLEO|nr:phosphoglycerate mutase-like protein [Lindgomyces ingoldianus]KAF2465895.1 phosphoglycerate mutase-like protein [Lindgomyces ingoldianus]